MRMRRLPGREASESWSWLGLEVLALTLLAVFVRAASLDHGAYLDELYHLLAARGWMADGEPRIAEGLYTRAWIYTMLTAWTFEVFGESVESARWLAVIFGALLVPLLFVWTRMVAGATAAWCAALLLCFSPDAIVVSRFARFYALHGSLFFLGAISIYAVVERQLTARSQMLVASGIAAVCFVLAYHLQITTAIGVAALALWVVVAVLFRPDPILPSVRMRWVFLATVLALAIAALIVMESMGAGLWHRLRHAPPWAAASRNVFWHYHAALIEDYGTLWPLTFLAVLIGLRSHPRPTLFCLMIFLPVIILHSVGGMKNMRYVYYVLPFLFVIWAISLQELWKRMTAFVLDASDGAATFLGLGKSSSARVTLAGMVALFVLGSNGAVLKSATLIAGLDRFMPVQNLPRWEAARVHFERWLREADIVITASDLEALYYLGRYDVLVSRSRAAEIRGHTNFDIDPRTGRPVIEDSASLERLKDCYRTGLIVTPARFWRLNPHVGNELADWIVEHTVEVGLPPELQVMAFVWDRPVEPDSQQRDVREPDCDDRQQGRRKPASRTEEPRP